MSTTCDQNFSSIRHCIWELLPQKTQKWTQIGPEPKKQWFLLAKATFYVRICEWPIDHWWQCRPNLGPKNIFWLNFPWILWFFWDLGLTLSIIPKDAAFAEILDFSNIFGFPEVNWAAKWPKTVNFSCIPFEPKFRILKDFSSTVFFLLETSYGRIFSKIKEYLGE